MKFRERPKSIPFLSRRDQLRLMLLVGGFAMVLIAFDWARRPQSWTWLAPQDEDVPVATEDAFRIAEDGGSLRPGEFRAVTERTPQIGTTNENGNRTGDREGIDWTLPDNASPRDLRIPPPLLAGIKDNTIGIRLDESPRFFEVVARVRDIPQANLEEAGRTDLVHAHFMVDPDVYRGQIVTLRGELRRLQPFAAATNAFGLETLYEGWMFTSDSGINPFRVVSTEIPASAVPGNEISLPVTVTGYFFKLEGYASEGGMHVAPLVIAKRIKLREIVGIPTRDDSAIVPYVAALLGLLVVGLGAVLWNFAVSDMVYRRGRAKKLLAPTEADLQAMKNVESVTVWEQLREIGDQIKESRDDGPDASESDRKSSRS